MIRDLSTRQWENIKFFTTVFLALTATTLSLITYSTTTGGKNIEYYSFIPISMIIIMIYGWKNHRRECERLFERMTTLAKIEEKIGFHDLRDENRVILKHDKYYLSDRFVKMDSIIPDHEEKNTNNFINCS